MGDNFLKKEKNGERVELKERGYKKPLVEESDILGKAFAVYLEGKRSHW